MLAVPMQQERMEHRAGLIVPVGSWPPVGTTGTED